MTVRVPIHQKPNAFATIEPKATIGAVVGVDLFWDDGTLVTEADFAPEPSEVPPGTVAGEVTLWRLVLEIPPNVTALENAAGTGLFAVTGAGTGALRTLADSSTITWTNGDGVAGNPTPNLADLANAGGGTLQRIVRDSKGRVAGSSAATTSDLPEGANLYFTDARAVAAVGGRLSLIASGAISALRIVVADGGLGRYPDTSVAADAAAVAGMAVTSAADGSTFDLVADGEWTDAGWAWTPGIVWCGAGGVLTQAPPSGWVLEVGRALDATRLLINVKTPFLRN